LSGVHFSSSSCDDSYKLLLLLNKTTLLLSFLFCPTFETLCKNDDAQYSLSDESALSHYPSPHEKRETPPKEFFYSKAWVFSGV
jgi:hypothetical protein